MLYIANAFSLNMLLWPDAVLRVKPIGLPQVVKHLNMFNWTSAIGHEDTCNVINSMLKEAGYNTPLWCNRMTVRADMLDMILVAQYRGPRLPEGTTVLPEGATIEWSIVKVVD